MVAAAGRRPAVESSGAAFGSIAARRTVATTFREWERDYVLFEGKPPQHPRDLTALYLYGMMNRLHSSRQLEAACWNRLDLIWLMQCQHPDHATMAGFVKQHGKRLRKLFRDVVRVGLRAKLIKRSRAARCPAARVRGRRCVAARRSSRASAGSNRVLACGDSCVAGWSRFVRNGRWRVRPRTSASCFDAGRRWSACCQ